MSGSKAIRLIIICIGIAFFSGSVYAAEFSADLHMTNPGDTAMGKIYVRDTIYRVENLEGKDKFLVIENTRTDITTAMNPEEMTYINLEGKSGAFVNPVKGWQYMAGNAVETHLGVETVNGFECDHYTYAYEGATEPHMESWISKRLGHFIKYVVHYSDDAGDGSMELRNIVEGPQDDALFAIPDGYERQKTADEIELERPALSTSKTTTAPAGGRMLSGGELIVKTDPELSVRVKLMNLIKDSAACHVHLYKNGQRIELSKLPEPEEETFVLAYKGDRKEPLYGMQHQADEVRVSVEKGRVFANVFNEYSSFDDLKRRQFYVTSPGRGLAGLKGRPIHLRLIGDSPAAESTHVKLHVYIQTYVDGGEQKETVEQLEFDLKNGEEKTLEYPVSTKANYVNVEIAEGGGVKLFFIQPE